MATVGARTAREQILSCIPRLPSPLAEVRVNLVGSPLPLGGLVLKNRLALAPMASRTATAEGAVTNETLAYYRRRSRDGVGLVVVEHAYVEPRGRLDERQISICRDSDVSGLSKLAYALHEQGVCALCQLAHAGGAATPAGEGELVAPSAVTPPGRRRHGNSTRVPRALTQDEIACLVDDFAAAASRAIAAGFDGVQVHAAHGYLLHQFFSPLTNDRSDGYGPQTVHTRLRFALEVVSAVRRAIGPAAVLSVRMGGSDYTPGGSTIADGVQAARLFAAAGADCLDVSGGVHNFGVHECGLPGFFRDASTAVRAAVDVPVVTTGGVHHPLEAQWLLQTGACDIVGVGRSIMRQPAWANVALEYMRRWAAGEA